MCWLQAKVHKHISVFCFVMFVCSCCCCSFLFLDYAACNHVITEGTGVITSPNYPASYIPSSDCTTYLSIPGASGLRVEFNTFVLENNHDYLYYGVGQDNAVARAIGRLSGRSLPDPIDFGVGVVWFRFISDVSIQLNGFSLTFTATIRKFNQSWNNYIA